MKKLKITVGILAWKSLKNLKIALDSYKNNGLLDICDEIIILFQEFSCEDLEFAKKYNVKFIALEDNVGIGQGFTKLATSARNDYIILLEHDWKLIEKSDIVYQRLKEGLFLIEDGLDVVRYRHRKFPGYPHYSFNLKGKELEYFDEWHQITSPHLLDSLHWLDPAKQFPDKISKHDNYFLTTSRYGNWTNNPCLFKKSFYLEVTKDFLGDNIDLERKIAYWWPRQNFKIAHGEGLFKHNDVVKHSKLNRLVEFMYNILKLKK